MVGREEESTTSGSEMTFATKMLRRAEKARTTKSQGGAGVVVDHHRKTQFALRQETENAMVHRPDERFGVYTNDNNFHAVKQNFLDALSEAEPYAAAVAKVQARPKTALQLQVDTQRQQFEGCRSRFNEISTRTYVDRWESTKQAEGPAQRRRDARRKTTMRNDQTRRATLERIAQEQSNALGAGGPSGSRPRTAPARSMDPQVDYTYRHWTSTGKSFPAPPIDFFLPPDGPAARREKDREERLREEARHQLATRHETDDEAKPGTIQELLLKKRLERARGYYLDSVVGGQQTLGDGGEAGVGENTTAANTRRGSSLLGLPAVEDEMDERALRRKERRRKTLLARNKRRRATQDFHGQLSPSQKRVTWKKKLESILREGTRVYRKLKRAKERRDREIAERRKSELRRNSINKMQLKHNPPPVKPPWTTRLRDAARPLSKKRLLHFKKWRFFPSRRRQVDDRAPVAATASPTAETCPPTLPETEHPPNDASNPPVETVKPKKRRRKSSKVQVLVIEHEDADAAPLDVADAAPLDVAADAVIVERAEGAKTAVDSVNKESRLETDDAAATSPEAGVETTPPVEDDSRDRSRRDARTPADARPAGAAPDPPKLRSGRRTRAVRPTTAEDEPRPKKKKKKKKKKTKSLPPLENVPAVFGAGDETAPPKMGDIPDAAEDNPNAAEDGYPNTQAAVSSETPPPPIEPAQEDVPNETATPPTLARRDWRTRLRGGISSLRRALDLRRALKDRRRRKRRAARVLCDEAEAGLSWEDRQELIRERARQRLLKNRLKRGAKYVYENAPRPRDVLLVPSKLRAARAAIPVPAPMVRAALWTVQTGTVASENAILAYAYCYLQGARLWQLCATRYLQEARYTYSDLVSAVLEGRAEEIVLIVKDRWAKLSIHVQTPDGTSMLLVAIQKALDLDTRLARRLRQDARTTGISAEKAYIALKKDKDLLRKDRVQRYWNKNGNLYKDTSAADLYLQSQAQTRVMAALIGLGADVNAQQDPHKHDGDAWGGLHYAVVTDNLDRCRWLVDRGAIVDLASTYGRTPLMIAARNDAPHCLHHLLAYSAKVSTSDRDGWTALHFAAHAGAQHCAALLLRAGANKLARTVDGVKSPMDLAKEQGHISTYWLITLFAEKDIPVKELFHVIEDSLERRNENDDGFSPPDATENTDDAPADAEPPAAQ